MILCEKVLKCKILYFTGKLFGLCPFNIDKDFNIGYSLFGTLYNIFISILYTICGLKISKVRSKLHIPRKTVLAHFIDSIGTLFQTLAVFSVWLELAFNQNEIRKIIITWKSQSSFIKFKRHYVFKELVLRFFLFNIYYVIIETILHYSTFHLIIPKEEEMLFNIFDYLHIIHRNWIIIFITFFEVINKKLCYINKQIYKWTNVESKFPLPKVQF